MTTKLVTLESAETMTQIVDLLDIHNVCCLKMPKWITQEEKLKIYREYPGVLRLEDRNSLPFLEPSIDSLNKYIRESNDKAASFVLKTIEPNIDTITCLQNRFMPSGISKEVLEKTSFDIIKRSIRQMGNTSTYKKRLKDLGVIFDFD